MDQNVEVNALANATRGFDRLFENDIAGARTLFNAKDDPFHQLGLGVCAFLEAALGMEAHIIEEAHRCLTLAEAGTRKFTKTKMAVENHRFHPGLEWEIINADTVVLLGLVNALSETYMGYLQCLYALNSAHSKFTRLYKTVFPNGIDSYTLSPPPPPGAISRETSFAGSVSYSSESSVASSTSTLPASPDVPDSKPVKRGFFSRLASSGTGSTPSLNAAHHRPHLHPAKPDGPVDDLIVAGTAFGYGLFNLVFSLLPKRIQSVVGFFGFKHDRKLALKALAVAAARNDTHSVFAGLVLMTYHGGVLLLSGYQANESRIVAEYQELVDRVFDRFPNGALWILNKAKILRMCHNPDAAINVLQDGLKPDRAFSFAQADALLVFELAWILLSERRYDEAAKMFLRMTELNTWSHATYYYIAAGCHWSLGNMEKAQELFDMIPGFVDKKFGGKELPTEVFLKKKIAFYKTKQKRLGKNEAKFVEAITISPSDEMGLFWNTHARISESVALLHIREWYSTTPVPSIVSPHHSPSTSPPPTPVSTPALDTPDEFALRALLLGVVHRTIKSYDTSREFLNDACERQESIEISTWIGGIANFELAVLELKEAEAFENAYYSTNGSTTTGSSTPASGAATPASTESLTIPGASNTQSAMAVMDKWKQAFKIATANLDKAMSLATSSTDLSSRLDTRVSMLRDEIASKKERIRL